MPNTFPRTPTAATGIVTPIAPDNDANNMTISTINIVKGPSSKIRFIICKVVLVNMYSLIIMYVNQTQKV